MFSFKSLLFGSAMVLTIAVTASAQTDWSGFYAGGSIGGALGRATADTTTAFSTVGYFAPSSVDAVKSSGRQSLHDGSFTGGLEGGFNIHNGKIVLGAEADYVALRMNASQLTTSAYPCCATSNFTLSQSVETRWLFTIRPRIGYAIGQSLFYLTGGLAVTKLNYQEAFSDNFAAAAESGSFNKTKAGWVMGIGSAYRLKPEHWSLKGEYLYTDFGRTTSSSNSLTAFTPPLTFPTNVFTHSLGLHAHVIRGGIDYRW